MEAEHSLLERLQGSRWQDACCLEDANQKSIKCLATRRFDSNRRGFGNTLTSAAVRSVAAALVAASAALASAAASTTLAGRRFAFAFGIK